MVTLNQQQLESYQAAWEAMEAYLKYRESGLLGEAHRAFMGKYREWLVMRTLQGWVCGETEVREDVGSQGEDAPSTDPSSSS